MSTRNPIIQFDPRKLAYYEKENYVAYYQKRWLRLMNVSVGMVKQAFNLNLFQAVYAAYLVARAEIAFAPFPDNDVPRAESYIRRFYAFIKGIHHMDFDIDQAAKLELGWWIAHRQLFGNKENQGLVDALLDLYTFIYKIDRARLQESVKQRALGMLYSDLWVNGGRDPNSPLLAQEEEALYKSYQSLYNAVNS